MEKLTFCADKLIGRAKGIEKFLLQLNSPAVIEQVEASYNSYFRSLEDLEDPEEDLMQWMDGDGDLGVAEMKGLSRDELMAQLGLPVSPDWTFPFFNSFISDLGSLPDEVNDFDSYKAPDDEQKALAERNLRRLEPRWHQIVGIAAIVRRVFEGRNVILADGVGVGKTLVCMGLMAYLRHLKIVDPKGEKRPKIGKSHKSANSGGG